ncbi:response regulator [Paenibacillus roseipurpureus]|uniref:Response regulator n=1 Tax=Paenibacillus roseopurpureus TaxID=2918901 RepID=A0AA96LKJ4_9BACL|nr:response regulator [Paenibacillus sp. MBLB1832]WNR42792.1 response regulator [Paenibacillus sp. MBLB1832]
MYKLILVDDEEIVRRGLRYFLDWESLGFQIVADFEDGRETIEYLKTHEVDIVLSDIRMAEVNGIQLAKHIYENYPQIRVIIISGYKDFEYAQQAIAYNVENYLLKPTKYDVITDVFQNLKLKLDQQKSDSIRQQQKSVRFDELLPLLKEQFYTDLVMGALRNTNELHKRIQLLSLSLDPAHCPCALIDLELYEREKLTIKPEKLTYSLKSIFLAENANFLYKAVFNEYQGMKLLAFPNHAVTQEELRKQLDTELNEIISRIRTNFDIEIRYHVTATFSNLIELAQFSLPLKLVYEETRGKDRLEPIEYDNLLEKYKLFMAHIMDGQIENTISMLDRLMDEFRDLPISFIHRLIMDLFAMVFRYYADRGQVGKIPHETAHNYHAVIEINDLEEIRKWAKQFIHDLMILNVNTKESNATLIVEAAQKYILQNFHRDLSLEEVANHVFLNHIYFSRIFKQALGINYIDYLTQLRIHKAIELLESRQFKIQEITEKVGYLNSKYFARLFKQTTGVSPKDYIRQQSLLSKGAENENKP